MGRIKILSVFSIMLDIDINTDTDTQTSPHNDNHEIGSTITETDGYVGSSDTETDN